MGWHDRPLRNSSACLAFQCRETHVSDVAEVAKTSGESSTSPRIARILANSATIAEAAAVTQVVSRRGEAVAPGHMEATLRLRRAIGFAMTSCADHDHYRLLRQEINIGDA